MKVLFVNEYSAKNPVSGAEFSMLALAKAVQAKIFTPQWKQNKTGKSLSPLWFNNPVYWLYSGWQIARQNFSLIHVHGKYILPGAIIAGWLKHKPVVVTVRDFKFLCPLALCFTKQQEKCSFGYFVSHEIKAYQRRYHNINWLILVFAKLWQSVLKWWLNQARQVIAVSPQLAQIYKNNGVKKVIFIYNLPPTLSRGKRKSGTNIVLSAGKLSYGKGTDLLVKAAEKLPQYRFVFIGEKNISFQEKFPPNCHYLGRLSHKETLNWYAKAKVFCLLSRWPEPLSRAGLEALSYGLALVVSNRGGNQELIKANGAAVNLESASAISKAIKQAMVNFSAFSRQSRRLIQTRFNRQKIIQKHLSIYQQYL